MFIVALASGGAYYPGFDFKDGQLLYLLNVFAKAGNGLGALVSFLYWVEPAPNEAARATFEYGGRCSGLRVLPGIELPAYEAYFVYPPALKNSKRVGVFRDFLVGKAREWQF